MTKKTGGGEADPFSRYAREWWNPDGAVGALHKLNAPRMAYIQKHLCGYLGKSLKNKKPLKGLSVLDIGCGGGLLCELLARQGAEVTGLDVSEEMIKVAKAHAVESGLAIDYRAQTVEAFCKKGKKFDLITVMEVLEHAADGVSLLREAAAMMKPEGLMILSTMNRTVKSYLLGIVMAEYVLGWTPKGAHDWRRFIKPSEMEAMLAAGAGLELKDVTGMVYNPLRDCFELADEKAGVNYIAAAGFGRSCQ